MENQKQTMASLGAEAAAFASACPERQAVAASCVLDPVGRFDSATLRAVHDARLSGLAHAQWGPLLARELPKSWLAEQNGLGEALAPGRGRGGWMDVLGAVFAAGVSKDVGDDLARRAAADTGIQGFLTAQSPGSLLALMVDSTRSDSPAPGPWQEELSGRLSARARLDLLLSTHQEAHRPEGPSLGALSRGAGSAMAGSVLSEPELAAEMLRALVMEGARCDAASELGLAGVFDALAANPRPSLPKEASKGLRKMAESFRGPVALAFESMCDGRFEAGLAAAAWACAMGERELICLGGS